MGFSRQEYWNGLPCPPPGNLPDPGIKLRSSALQVDYLSSESPGKPVTSWRGSKEDLVFFFLFFLFFFEKQLRSFNRDREITRLPF